MCLVVLFFRAVEDAPVVVGANREEEYARGGEPPQLLEGPVQAVAGLDPRAGGTWLGLNEHGVLVAVTNRRKSQKPEKPRSRGLLVRELLGCPDTAAAVDLATRELDRGPYAGCNILCADAQRAVVLQAGDWLRVRHLPPGAHVLTNDDVNDASDPRIDYALWWLHERTYATSDDCLAALKELCARRGEGGPDICFREQTRGTVSSTLIAVREPVSTGVYQHAQGPPDRTPYEDYSHLLRKMTR
jgi:uncharacterized protein with NRDE domain